MSFQCSEKVGRGRLFAVAFATSNRRLGIVKPGGSSVKRIGQFVLVSALSAVLSSGGVLAQDHHDAHNQQYVKHDEWKKGAKISHDDWNRGETVDYKTYHLKAPPRGYEWREVDGNYVLAAAATGVIASAIVAASIH